MTFISYFCKASKSSHPEVFFKKGALRNLAKFKGKHLCQSLFFNKVADKAKFLRTTFLTEHPLVAASELPILDVCDGTEVTTGGVLQKSCS